MVRTEHDSTSRRAVLVLAASALGLGLIGCGSTGTQDESTAPARTTSSQEPSGSSGADGASNTPAPITEDDLTAAKELVHEILASLAAGDYDTVCRSTISPASGQPVSEAELPACVQTLSATGEESPIPQEIVPRTTVDKLDARDNGDGTITVRMLEVGFDFPYLVVKASDGKLYARMTTAA